MFAGVNVPPTVEYQIKKKNGGTLWVELKIQFTYDGDTIKGATVIAHDISERKRAEEALRNREEYLRVVLESIADEVFVHDLEGRFLMVNNVACRNTGYSREELLTMHVRDIDPHSDPRNDSMTYWAQLDGATSVQFFAEHQRRDGSTYPVEINMNQIQMTEDQRIIAVARDITERKKAEEEREKLLSRLQSTLEATADGILVVDNTKKQVIYSSRFAKIWGIPKEILKTNDNDQMLAFVLDHVKDPDNFLDKTKQLYANPEAKSFDTIELKDNRILERYSRPHKLNDQIIGRVWSFRDVTKQKHAEKELEQSKERYQELVENINDVIFSVDESGLITYVSPQVESVFGYRPEELITIAFINLIHPNDLDDIICAFNNVLGGNLYPSEYRIKSKIGKYHWVRSSSRPIQDDGKIVGLHGVLTDITDQKEAEIALRESEKRFRQMADLLPGAVVEMDSEMNVLYVNQHGLESFGYSQDDIDAGIMGVNLVHPEERKKAIERFSEYFDGHDLPSTEYRIIKKNGEPFWVLFNATPIINDKKIEGFLCILIDISRQKDSERKREKLIEELQSALAEVKTLSGLLPICSYCKKIRDDKGYWNQLEQYIHDHSEAKFSHGICQECLKKYYPDLDTNGD